MVECTIPLLLVQARALPGYFQHQPIKRIPFRKPMRQAGRVSQYVQTKKTAAEAAVLHLHPVSDQLSPNVRREPSNERG